MYIVFDKTFSSVNKVAEFIGCTGSAIRTRARRENISIEEAAVKIYKRKQQKYLRDTFFEEPLSEEAYYMIGFILADGCIHKRYRTQKGHTGWEHTLQIGLNEKDAELLLKFQKLLHLPKSNNLSYKSEAKSKERSVKLTVSSKAIFEQLSSYGITPAKSLTVTVDPRLKNNRHFWRGVIDGDGSFSNEVCTLIGTKDVCESFNTFIGLNGRLKQVGPNTYTIRFRKEETKYIIKVLYKDAKIALNRKLQQVNRICDLD